MVNLITRILVLSMLCYCSVWSKVTVDVTTLPHFFIIGSAKCGTTSLHALLELSKVICHGLKEHHFFDKADVFAKGLKQYYSRFNVNCSVPYHMDSSPSYLNNALVPLRMSQFYPPAEFMKKKFIIVLRDPVYQAYSWYNHLMYRCVMSMNNYMKTHKMPKNGWNLDELCVGYCGSCGCKKHAQFAKLDEEVKYLSTFEEYVSLPDGTLRPLSTGLYINHIKKWLEFVPRSNLFIINLSRLIEETGDTMNRLMTFLNVNGHHFDNSTKLPHVNVASVETEFACSARQKLYAYFDPYTKELMEFLVKGNVTAIKLKDRIHLKPATEPEFKPFKEYRC